LIFKFYSIFSFIDRCLSFCTFSFGHCIVCSSIYGFWLPLWYLQALLVHAFWLMVSVLASSAVDRGFEPRSQGRIEEGGTCAPLKLEKMIFWRKIVIFHTKYPKNFRASLRSAQFFLSAPPNWKSRIRPWIGSNQRM
jgi:hypothetical protein